MTCDRVVIINRGKIAAVDTPANLSAKASGGQHIRIEVEASEAPLRAALGEITGVQSMDIEPAGAPGRLAATVETVPGTDVRSQIAAKVVGKGWPLFELRGANMSLEDIFLQLTTDDSSHAVEHSN
jgi:ABC-2 type transport system ATP-binding protein